MIALGDDGLLGVLQRQRRHVHRALQDHRLADLGAAVGHPVHRVDVVPAAHEVVVPDGQGDPLRGERRHREGRRRHRLCVGERREVLLREDVLGVGRDDREGPVAVDVGLLLAPGDLGDALVHRGDLEFVAGDVGLLLLGLLGQVHHGVDEVLGGDLLAVRPRDVVAQSHDRFPGFRIELDALSEPWRDLVLIVDVEIRERVVEVVRSDDAVGRGERVEVLDEGGTRAEGVDVDLRLFTPGARVSARSPLLEAASGGSACGGNGDRAGEEGAAAR